jgi:hypothetical protein
MGVVFPRLNRTDARGYHGNIGVAGRDPRIASVEHRIASGIASDVGARCRTSAVSFEDRNRSPVRSPARDRTTRPAALRHGLRDDVNLPAPTRLLVKFVGFGGRLITAAAAVVFVAQFFAETLRRWHCRCAAAILANRIKWRNFSNNRSNSIRMRRHRRQLPGRAPLAASGLRCRTGVKLEWPF